MRPPSPESESPAKLSATAGAPSRAVLFDLMDTLIEDPFHPVIEARLRRSGLSRAEFRACKSQETFLRFELGQISEAVYFRDFYRCADERFPDPRRLKKEMFRRPPRFRPGMREWLLELQSRPDILIGLASNYSIWYHQVLDLLPIVKEATDLLFFSCELGIRKPDPAYYAAIEDALQRIQPGLPPEAIYFTDDRTENLEAAATRGWKTLLYPPAGDPGATLSHLQSWLDS